MNNIDCLFIGNNDIRLNDYEKILKLSGVDSVPYRELNLNFVQYENNLFSVVDLFNHFYSYNEASDSKIAPIVSSDIFNYTIAYLGTYLHKNGLSFDYINAFQNEKPKLVDKLKNAHIRSIVIICTHYTSRYPIYEIISFIKKYNTSAKIIIGGPYVSLAVNRLEEVELQNFFKLNCADFYIHNFQGEAALVNLINSLKFNTPLAEVKNIYYKSGNKFIATPKEMEDNRLEDNMIDWNLFSEGMGELTLIRTAISCPFACSFCTFSALAGEYQTLNVEFIEAELNLIHSIGKVNYIHFIDDTLNVPPERFKSILRMMIKNKYNFKWDSFFRCQFADEEMVELMKESGCQMVFLGIESGSQKILDNMNKNVTTTQYKKGIQLLNKHKISTYASFIIGFPGETLETYEETLKFIEDTQPTVYRAAMWYCDEFSPIYSKKAFYNIQGSRYSWSHSTMDSNTAFSLLEKMFLTIKNSTFTLVFNFDYMLIPHLLQRGLELNEIKEFLNIFNSAIAEKLINPLQKEVSSDFIKKISTVFQI